MYMYISVYSKQEYFYYFLVEYRMISNADPAESWE